MILDFPFALVGLTVTTLVGPVAAGLYLAVALGRDQNRK